MRVLNKNLAKPIVCRLVFFAIQTVRAWQIPRSLSDLSKSCPSIAMRVEGLILITATEFDLGTHPLC